MINGVWPDHLVRDIARRRSIIVLGAGVSRQAIGADGGTRPPVWRDFLEQAAAKFVGDDSAAHIFKAIENGDLLHACEWLKGRYDEDWTEYLRSQFVRPRFSPGKIHEVISLLDNRVVFSLNFDEIYESKAKLINEESLFVKNYYDDDVCEFLRGDARYVVKIHGNLSSPANLIFTQEEYARARSKYRFFYSAFDAALMTHTFLFIGCGYGDPDVNLLLENQSFSSVSAVVEPHYFLTSEEMPEDLRRSLRKNRNLKVLPYDKKDDEHAGLVSALEDLYQLVIAKRAFLEENGNW